MNKDTREQLLRANPKRGSNQIAVRGHNERLILQLIREHGTLTKAEATRATGLSANAVSVIFRALEQDDLLIRGEPIRGRIGQPSVPLRLNPEARHYVTLKIGRRSLDLAVVDFVGTIKSASSRALPNPTPSAALDFVKDELTNLLRRAKQTRASISGMGVAMPFELWSWTEEIAAPREDMRDWQDFDVTAQLGELVPWPITVENDASAACRGELVFGHHTGRQDWVYFFVGTFIGGGVVLNGSLYSGRRGNAGCFGPMRVPDQSGGNRLIDHASLVVLERAIAAEGGHPYAIYEDSSDWDRFEPHVSAWIERASRNLAHAIVSSLSVMDFEAVVIDGALPEAIKTRLVAAVRGQFAQIDHQGVLVPDIEPGKLGRAARTLGAAAAMISSDFMIDQNRLMRA